MKRYCARYDDHLVGMFMPTQVVIGESDSLTEILAIAAKFGRGAYVAHVPTDLQRYEIEGRVVWLERHGNEHPTPR